MPTTVQVPDFNYSARLYAQIRRELRQRGRVNSPELTVEADTDPFMQLEQDVAIIGHMANTMLDWVARHFSLPTSLYRPGVAALLRVIDETLSAATPATADVVAKLTRTFIAAQAVLVPAYSRFSTVPGEDSPSIAFESAATAIGCSRNDQLVYYAYDQGTSLYAVPAVAADMWPTAVEAGDMLYVGHQDLMFDEALVALGVAGVAFEGVWEYHGHSEETPDSVSVVGANYRFALTSLLGSANRIGAFISVLCQATGASVTVDSTYITFVNYAVIPTTAFGQSVPSTVATDYIVSVEWTEVTGAAGGNIALDSITETDVLWDLPQTLTDSWTVETVNSVEAYWVRFRVLLTTGPVTEPRLSAIIGPGDAEFYVLVPVTQGETVDDTLGTSDGSASQAFPLNRATEGYIEGTLTSLTVGTDNSWVVTDEATDLYSADPTEKVALLEMVPDGTYQVLFGDGTNGAIPTSGDQITASYRVNAADDGNVGAEAIARNTSGVSYLTDITNPRPAVGWAAAEGSTQADLERVKRTKPAAFRSQGKAINADDCEALVVDDFLTAAGARPVARAWGVEELYGLKTIGLVCVANGGGVLTASVLEEVNTWFNGGDPNDPLRRLIANYELTTSNFGALVVNGAITVTVRRSGAGVEDQVQQILTALLNPLAQYDDGSWRWEPGRYNPTGVRPNQIEAAVYEELTVRRAVEVEVTDINGGGAVPAALGNDQLPTMGAWIVTVAVI